MLTINSHTSLCLFMTYMRINCRYIMFLQTVQTTQTVQGTKLWFGWFQAHSGLIWKTLFKPPKLTIAYLCWLLLRFYQLRQTTTTLR